jgi:hypothetical protein
MHQVTRITGAFPPRNLAVIRLAALVFIIGCSNALNYEVAKLTGEQRTLLQQILTADQVKKLDDWIDRNSKYGKGLPARVTVGQALQNQAEWLATQTAEKAKADELRMQLQARHAARQDEIAKLLSITLVSKSNRIREDDRQFVAFELAYANKTAKDIQGVTGVLKLNNVYGDPVIDISWSFDGELPAKHIAVERSAGIYISRSVEPQMALWNTDFEKLKSAFEVRKINFKDGTSVSDPL